MIRPGFDVIGLALSIWLELRVRVEDPATSSSSSSSGGSSAPLNCVITYEGQGAGQVDLDARRNLITRTALYVLRCHGRSAFPPETHVHIRNAIPLGRGLGSSGAAVVAGVALANELGLLGLSRARMLDFCLMIERHPDNVAAALYGGLVSTHLNALPPADAERKEIPLSEVLPPPPPPEPEPEPAGGGLAPTASALSPSPPPPPPPLPPLPPRDIGGFQRCAWADEIRAVAVIPDFEVPTAEARAALPPAYARHDVIFNMQRVALLLRALGQSPPDAAAISQGMRDRLHQPYRAALIPGLPGILERVTPAAHPGLLGTCVSGAGPTILALATHAFADIAAAIMARFAAEGIQCRWELLEPAFEGTTVQRHDRLPSQMEASSV